MSGRGLRAVLRRTGFTLFVIWGAATAAFLALHLMPGDPVITLLGDMLPPAARVEQIRHELGLDQPLPVQYLDYLGRLAHGDLGRSYQLEAPVVAVLAGQIGPTAALTLGAFGLAIALSVPLALATAGRRPLLRRIATTLELVAVSTPAFWVGALLLSMLSFRLHWFPVAGNSGIPGLVLPTVTLAIGLAGVFSPVLRDGVERALLEPFVLSSRARGTSEVGVRVRHALRHAAIPLITLSGWTIGTLLSGAVVVETVFTRQGIGRVLATAISARDMPMVTGIVVIAAAVFAVLNLIVDVLYRAVDHRLATRSEGASR
ncbi:ABC transporter permease [Amycolatopsis sp. NPDC004079]|uniref:ABC transporter permease n=1 Tax=Amycolatopsis sp. NPDC004079 TaxID=3154549 RepID=UPI0033B37529